MKYIQRPKIVNAAGNRPKQIDEFIGRVNSGNAEASIARMKSPGGWVERVRRTPPSGSLYRNHFY